MLILSRATLNLVLTAESSTGFFPRLDSSLSREPRPHRLPLAPRLRVISRQVVKWVMGQVGIRSEQEEALKHDAGLYGGDASRHVE